MVIHIDSEKSPVFFVRFQGIEQRRGGRGVPLLVPPYAGEIEPGMDKQGRPLFLSSRSVMGVVLRNPVQRGVMTALAWFISFPPTFKVFEAASEATAWVQKTLAASAAGHHPPPG
jgi:hypothetical protein